MFTNRCLCLIDLRESEAVDFSTLMTAMRVEEILEKSAAGERITGDEAALLLDSNNLPLLGMAAHNARLRKHPEPVATYIIERNINYSNVCVADCDFCGFHVEHGDTERAYVLTDEQLDSKIEEMVQAGGHQILLQGGLHPTLPLEWYETMLRRIKDKYGIHIHGFSPPEIQWFSRLTGLSLHDVIRRLHAAGLDSIPGGGAEILVDRVRHAISKNKTLTADWLAVMRTASECELRTTATMMFGHVETPRERIEHLERIRELQDDTGVFTAFICWPFQKSPSLRLQCPTAGAHEYLKMTAVARLFLDNIENLQSSWVTMGSKVGQIALHFGCNDMGSTMMEENVVRSVGTSHSANSAELETLIRDAGFTPRRRNFYYDPTDEPRRMRLE